jgi:hypothetical protein
MQANVDLFIDKDDKEFAIKRYNISQDLNKDMVNSWVNDFNYEVCVDDEVH